MVERHRGHDRDKVGTEPVANTTRSGRSMPALNVAVMDTLNGGGHTLFSHDAVTLIHNASRGYPRAINNLAVNALTSAFTRNSPIVDEKAARIAISETGAD